MIPNIALRAKATKDCDVGKLCRSSAGYAPPEQGAFEPMTSGWDWSSCKSAVGANHTKLAPQLVRLQPSANHQAGNQSKG